MNPIEKFQLCNTTLSAMKHGVSSLRDVPGLLRRIIEERAWEERQIPSKGTVRMKSLRELITTAPIIGWGEDPAKIEALLKDDAEALVLFREAMKGKTGRKAKSECVDNVNALETAKGNSRSYTLDRLSRESPELFEQVKAGELSANAAAIKAGFRKRKTPLDQLKAAWAKASAQEREQFIKEHL